MKSTEEISTLFGYKKLIAWNRADELAQRIYKLTLQFPKEEAFGITSQLRRAALSVPTNIVEGYSRNSKNEFRRFLSIALGSLAETGYLLDFAYQQNYFTKDELGQIYDLKEETGRIMWKLYNSQR